ncbi:hypothetical protein AA313_de0208604 [Arthrobotrys entomopaga]|nr:hypothetical protein AA313_de0208604 [Arthrobotrys entomopaga]
MSAKEKAELGLTAAGSVYAVSQLVEGFRSDKHGSSEDANKHYIKAATGAAVAVGAYEMRKAEKAAPVSPSQAYERDGKTRGNRIKKHQRTEYRPPKRLREHEHGHTRRLLEETVGAYALGRELMGDKKHHKAHVAAETLGAVGALREARRHHH